MDARIYTEETDQQETSETRRFQAFNPEKNEVIPGWYRITSQEELDNTVRAAHASFRLYRNTSGVARAGFLECIAEEILRLGDRLIKTCTQETGLPEGRIIQERARTVNQLKLFAEVVKEGSWVNARIDTAIPDRVPASRPDVRQMQRPLGPVAVFEASNFPLAFSTAGGDVASALAAGCTVVVKSHASHPGTSELVAGAIMRAAAETGMPKGTFSLVHGPGRETGIALVSHSLIKAVGFTGSFSGGKALFDAANSRKEPIPVYAEMGSINPVFVLPDAMRTRMEEIASALVDAIVLGAGQFCTNPGLIVVENSVDATRFIHALGERIRAVPAATMLSKKIHESFLRRIEEVRAVPGVTKMGEGQRTEKPCQGVPQLFFTTYSVFMKNDTLSEEVFGPSSMVVVTNNREETIAMAHALGGHLTTTLHATPRDLSEWTDLIGVLEEKAGRLILNGVPTGVEVCHAMVHGGPYPATTDSRSTSVGTTAIYRFTRPVCYQGFPQQVLPDELKNDNPLNIVRMVNGVSNNDKLLTVL